MSLLGFFGFIIVVSVIVFYTFIIKEEGYTVLPIVFLPIAVIGLIFILEDISNTPTALDVYKGKTELRITYDGKVPVDTVVIYKKGEVRNEE